MNTDLLTLARQERGRLDAEIARLVRKRDALDGLIALEEPAAALDVRQMAPAAPPIALTYPEPEIPPVLPAPRPAPEPEPQAMELQCDSIVAAEPPPGVFDIGEAQLAGLTPRQRSIVEQAAEGVPSDEIGAAVGMTGASVRGTISKLRRERGIALPVKKSGPPKVKARPAAATPADALTERQREIAEKSAQGISAVAIGAALGIDSSTVRSVRTKLRDKGYSFPHGVRGRRAATDHARATDEPEPPPAEADDEPADDPQGEDDDDALPPPIDDETDAGPVMPEQHGQPPQRVAKPKPVFDTPAPPPIPPAEDHELAFVLAWLREDAGVRVVDSKEKAGTWDVGWSGQSKRAAQPNLPIDALFRYANDIRVKAGMAPFKMPTGKGA